MHISLAPFQGITHKGYRKAYIQSFPGLDAVYSPFISGVNPQKVNPSKFTDVLPFENTPIATVPQFVSTDSKEIIAIAHFLKQEGYDHINWNMGCPFSRLANKKRGCGILPYPDEIRAMLDEIMPEIPVRLSIKARLGYRSPDELSQVITVLNDYPLKELIIHPRIGTQLYKGEVNLDYFTRCLQQSKIPICYNGDIYHAGRYHELSRQFPGVKAWMIGRGALINPFLASQMKGILLTDNDKRERLHQFHGMLIQDMAERQIRPERQLGSLKGVWYYMSGVFTDGPLFFQKIKVCNNLKDYFKVHEDLMHQPFAPEQEIENYFRMGLKHI